LNSVIVKPIFTSVAVVKRGSLEPAPLFDPEAKLIKAMAPMLARVVVVDPQPHSARFTGELMRNIAHSQVWVAETNEKALRMVGSYDPHIVFVEMSAGGVNGLEFTRALRRSRMKSRYAPVIMVTSQATAHGILAARDAGVHEFLRKPFTMKDLLRRLEAVTLRQRDWVEAVGYIGPDRRRFNSGDYTGPLKRRSDSQVTPDAARMAQALKILRSSIAAVDIDPEQAMRSMLVQAADLQKAGMAVADLKLTTAAIDFGRYLAEIEPQGAPYDKEQLQQRAAPLLAYMPRDDEAAAFAA
jgi:DNA-binding response OmpR family regulator